MSGQPSAVSRALPTHSGRGVVMPRRKTTRAQDRAKRVDAERQLNDAHVAERNKPPPF
jgi:hypothetical protein